MRSFADLGAGELYALLALRQEVFVVEQRCAYLDADGVDLRSHHLFTRDTSGSCLACLRIVEPGVKYPEPSLGRVATRVSHRGIGLGRELMREGLLRIRELYGNVPVRISAQCYLQRFYESFGFAPVGDPYPEDDIPHIEMWQAP